MDEHECITETELEDFTRLNGEERQVLILKGTGDCVYCRRIWMKFWASRKSKSNTIG